MTKEVCGPDPETEKNMILETIVRDKRIRLAEHKARIPETDMRALAEDALKAHEFEDDLFYRNMSKPGISIIGEFKQASPSLGRIESKIDLMERIDEYNECVDAISCLTEPCWFRGSLDILREIRQAVSLPFSIFADVPVRGTIRSG